MTNTLINIGGSSGVGKTTLSTFLSFIFTDALHLSGDDLHKWERHDDNWKSKTHLNPSANNLDLGKKQLISLVYGESVKRNHYNHSTGKFDKDINVQPKKVIINEGLHSLYDKDLCKLASLNIFIKVGKGLKYQWKLNRDTEKRGYTKEQVLSAMKRREVDEEKYIQPQEKNADVIVTFSEKRDKSVHLDYECKNEYGCDLMLTVKKLYNLHRGFLLSCRKSCFEYELIQGAGGNLSYKFKDKIIITASGKTMSDVHILGGFAVCDNNGIYNDERPSMELDFHKKIKQRIVYHTHPIYVNVILCSKQSKEIMSEILEDYDFDYVEYVTPGKELGERLNVSEKIVLLENHGLICSGNSFEETFNMSLKLNQLCKEWLIRNSKTFKTFRDKFVNSDTDCILFPDAAIIPEDNLQLNDYMLHIQNEVGLEPNCLTSDEIHKLQNMESEKYRMSINK
tara:strand:+ start:1978 stop:3336 length:1359 start_codon:yes stop_codon:yes gene_type:complete